jgi:hypothetical protein
MVPEKIISSLMEKKNEEQEDLKGNI